MPKLDSTPSWIHLPTVRDPRGVLAIAEPPLIPFEIGRVYFLYDISTGAERGAHAHKTLEQVFIPVSGSFLLAVDDGVGPLQEFAMNDPSKALHLPAGYWRRLTGFSSGAVALVLASSRYDEGTILRTREEFESWLGEA